MKSVNYETLDHIDRHILDEFAKNGRDRKLADAGRGTAVNKPARASSHEGLDLIDRHILEELSKDGRISVAELSRRVNLSKTPCQARITRLEQAGYILGYRAVIDPKRLGLPHVAFVEVKLSDTRKAALSAFNKAVRAIPEVEQAHMIASSFDYLLKVRTKDIADYREVLGERISALPHVAHTSTHVSMEAVKGDED